MSTEKYLERHFGEIREIEFEMIRRYSEIAETLSDEEVRSTFIELKEEETNHRDIVDKLIKIIRDP